MVERGGSCWLVVFLFLRGVKAEIGGFGYRIEKRESCSYSSGAFFLLRREGGWIGVLMFFGELDRRTYASSRRI